jgi:hypothetical protein
MAVQNGVVPMANGHGGKRAGAGRPKNSANKRHDFTRNSLANSSVRLPLQYMVEVMNDETQPASRRDAMAIAAANFIHSKPVARPIPAAGWAADADGKLIEAVAEPIAPSVMTINILPVESGFHLDQDSNLVRAAQPGPELRIVSNVPAPEPVDDSNGAD